MMCCISRAAKTQIHKTLIIPKGQLGLFSPLKQRKHSYCTLPLPTEGAQKVACGKVWDKSIKSRMKINTFNL